MEMPWGAGGRGGGSFCFGHVKIEMHFLIFKQRFQIDSCISESVAQGEVMAVDINMGVISI